MVLGNHTDPGDPGATKSPTREISTKDQVFWMTKNSDGLTPHPGLYHKLTAGPGRMAHWNKALLPTDSVRGEKEGQWSAPGQGLEAGKMFKVRGPHPHSPGGTICTP